MFFKFRKSSELEENEKKEQQLIEEEKNRKQHEYHAACDENEKTFYTICHMVRSLPKERQIVVVQRKNIFKDKHHRNECYLEMARRMSYEHRLVGKNWISGYYDSLYAFYKPSVYTFGFVEALYKFSKNGYRI